MKLLIELFLFSTLVISGPCIATMLDQSEVNDFVEHMVTTHRFDSAELQSLFSMAVKSERVLTAISRPAEALPWYKYRALFIQPDRIEQGINFWASHEATLKRAEDEYGVPAKYIVAIIGVETRYGSNKGNDRVLDALSTLAFHYPKRSSFFRGELEHFLLLTREQRIDPLSLKGSYAGAMGMPQFIPSSYRHYAVDFDHDGMIDIWNNPVDAIGSVANYFKEHGWQPGHKVVIPGKVTSDKYRDLLTSDLKPAVLVDNLKEYGIQYDEDISPETFVNVMSLENLNDNEIWLGLDNFYVITRYNHSALYAMAVYLLAEAIQDKYRNKNVADNR